MQNAEKAKEVQGALGAMGHQAFTASTNELYIGLSDEQKEKLKLHQKYDNDAIMEHYNIISKSDCILVLNYDKHGIAGYIGGNSFLEMGFAYTQRKPIFLLYQIPEMPYYKTEIIAMKPVVINGDLKKIIG